MIHIKWEKSPETRSPSIFNSFFESLIERLRAGDKGTGGMQQARSPLPAKKKVKKMVSDIVIEGKERSKKLFEYLFKRRTREQERRATARQNIKQNIERPRSLVARNSSSQMRSWPRYSPPDILENDRWFRSLDNSRRRLPQRRHVQRQLSYPR